MKFDGDIKLVCSFQQKFESQLRAEMGQRCEREEKEILMNWAYYIVLPEADTELTSLCRVLL